jgi:hypothetical protein
MHTPHIDFMFKVVVRRVSSGNSPFGWEVYRGDTVVPLQVSSDRFSSMEEAYMAGRSRLPSLMPQKKPTPVKAARGGAARGARAKAERAPA